MRLWLEPTDVGTVTFDAEHRSSSPEAVPPGHPNQATLSTDVVDELVRLRGRVVDEQDRPVAGASHSPTCPPTDGSTGRRLATTDADGAYRMYGTDAGQYRMQVIPPAGVDAPQQWADGIRERHRAKVIDLPPPNPPEEFAPYVTLRLAATRRIDGVVTDHRRVPVASVTVRAYAEATPGQVAATATTAADGSYSLPVTWRGDYYLSFTPPPNAPVGIEWWNGQIDRATAYPRSVELPTVTADVDLTPAGSITGRVVGPDGPVAGARIVRYWWAARWAGTASTVTGPDGTFTLTNVHSVLDWELRIVPPAGSGLDQEWYQDAATRDGSTAIDVITGEAVDVEIVLD